MSAALTWLLDGIATVPGNDARVQDLTLDSREVKRGTLFFALAGKKTHGLKFALDAAARGACAVLWEPLDAQSPPVLPATTFGAAVPNLRELVGRIADRFFNWPSSHLRITGITGTNGKTTCAFLLAQCLEKLGASSAYIGTLGWGRTGALEAQAHTTADVVTVHRQLAQLRAAGIREVSMEVSSHALDQDRVAAVRFHTAAFTNLTRDHLDYHGSMAAYGAAKARLFAAPDLKQIVLNIGDEFGRALAHERRGPIPVTAVTIDTGTSGWVAQRELRAVEVQTHKQGISVKLDGTFGAATLNTHLMGRFNAENSLVVIACLLSLSVQLSDAVRVLGECHAAPGRMEMIDAGASKPTAVVDYAHTPDALAKALSAAREHCNGSLWCVFGCGGDRDSGKRPLMGAIADELADQIIVTDDNPRFENPELITSAILAGIRTHAVRVIHDRSTAIETAIKEARPLDLVLIAGKGHEDYQIYGDTRRRFSDRSEAQRHLGVAA